MDEDASVRAETVLFVTDDAEFEQNLDCIGKGLSIWVLMPILPHPAPPRMLFWNDIMQIVPS
jgi:hypothetical protein